MNTRAIAPERLQTLGRWGVAAIGLVWGLLGWIALQLAVRGRPAAGSTDNTGALATLAGSGLGKGLLALALAGLAAYVLWQLAEAGWGQADESGAKRAGRRLASLGKAAAAGALAATIVKLLLDTGVRSSSQEQAEWTGRLLALPGGVVLVVLGGLAVLALGVSDVVKGATRRFTEKLDGRQPAWTEPLGVAGLCARGVSFAILGVLLVAAALTRDASKGGGLDAALTSLLDLPFGRVLLGLVALGADQLRRVRVDHCPVPPRGLTPRGTARPPEGRAGRRRRGRQSR